MLVTLIKLIATFTLNQVKRQWTYYRQYAVVLFVWLASTSVMAQTDSLFNLRWNQLHNAALEYSYGGKPEKATAYTDSMYLMAEAVKNDSLRIFALIQKGSVIPDGPETRSVLEYILREATNVGIPNLTAQAHNNLALQAFGMGDVKTSYQHAQYLLQLAAEHPEISKIKQYALLNLMQIYGYAGNYSLSNKMCRELIQLLEVKLGSNSNQQYLYRRLVQARLTVGQNYDLMHLYDEAQLALDSALLIAYQSKTPINVLTSYTALANHYVSAHIKEGNSLPQLKATLDSIEAYSALLTGLEKLHYQYSKARYYTMIHQPEKSIAMLLPMLKNGRDMDDRAGILNSLKLISDAFKEAGKTDSAFLYFTQWAALKDSILDQQIRYQLDIYEVDQQIAQKEIERIELAQKAALWKQRTRLISIGAVVAGILAIIAAVFAWITRQQANKIEHLNVSLSHINEKLNRFAGTVSHDMIAHLDIFLTKISMLPATAPQSPLQQFSIEARHFAQQMKSYCIQLLKEARNQQQPDEAPLTDPIPTINTVLQDFEIPLKAKNFKIELSQLPSSTLPPVVVNHLFQNLISNAIRYVNVEHPTLRIYGTDGQWIIEDNGPGLTKEQTERLFAQTMPSAKGAGVGLFQVKNSLKEYGADIRAVQATPNGAKFIILLPKSINM